MARSCEVNVDIYGKSAHIAKASEGIDAVAAGVEFYRRAVEMERSLPGNIFRLLKFGVFRSGTIRNALSAHTRIEGSLRAFQDEVFEYLRDGLFRNGHFLCRISLLGPVRISLNYPKIHRKPCKPF